MAELKYQIIWSIYIAGKNVQKVRNKHLPAVNQAIELPDKKWTVYTEEYNPDEVRMFGESHYEGLEKQDMALCYFRWLSQLANGQWNIVGLQTIHQERALYLMGTFQTSTPKSAAPAVTNAMVELQQIGQDYTDPHPTQIVLSKI